jgi:hypothetical protein
MTKGGGLLLAMLLLITACSRGVSGEYHQENDPTKFIILKSDGTCQRDNYAGKYSIEGKNITITMQMMGMVFNGTLDGDHLTLNEPDIFGHPKQTTFVRRP